MARLEDLTPGARNTGVVAGSAAVEGTLNYFTQVIEATYSASWRLASCGFFRRSCTTGTFLSG